MRAPCDNCDDGMAIGYYMTETGIRFYLCETCNSAFGLGQCNPDAEFKDWRNPEEEPTERNQQ